MNNSKIVLTSIAIVSLFGGIYYLSSQRPSLEPKTMMKKAPQVVEEEVMKKELSDAVTPKQETMEKDSNKMMKLDLSRYIEYSKTVIEQSANKRRVLYFFATWCPSCKAANEDFSANPNKIPEDVVVIRTNYNDPDTDQEEKNLAKKYGITYQHTFVQVDSVGKEIAKWNGGQIKELIMNIK